MTFRFDPPEDLAESAFEAAVIAEDERMGAVEDALAALPGYATPGRRASLPLWDHSRDPQNARVEDALCSFTSGYVRGSALVVMARFGSYDAPLPNEDALQTRFGGTWNERGDELLGHRIPGTRIVLVHVPWQEEPRAIVWIVLRPSARGDLT